MKRWLVIDCNGLCHRSAHAMEGLSHSGKKTGAIYGLFRDLVTLERMYGSDCGIVLCFDYGKQFRKDLDPTYKAHRRPDPSINRQIDLIATLLPKIGYANVVWQDGYEADDWIAHIVNTSLEKERITIVSCDNDMFQLLQPGVTMFMPNVKREMTAEQFTAERGVYPDQWVQIKALMGDVGDNIKGIKGVGEINAVKFIQGKLENARLLQAIKDGEKTLALNRKLIKLPWPGLPLFCPGEDKIDSEAWNKACVDYGMLSLMKH